MRFSVVGNKMATNSSCDVASSANASNNFLLVTCDSYDISANGHCHSSLMSINYTMPGLTLLAVALISVIVFTALGNLLVGAALLRFRPLRTVSNLLIGNLALSDFLLAVVVLPLSTVNECLGHWVFGRAACNLWLVIDVLCCTASIWNLCMIALDRFTATFYPLWYRGEGRRRGGRHAAICSLVVWAIAAAACLPPLLGWNDLASNYIETTVALQSTARARKSYEIEAGDEWSGDCNSLAIVHRCILFRTPSYVLYSASVSFFVPCFVTLVLYANILFALRRRRTKSASISSGPRYPSVDQTIPSAVSAPASFVVTGRRRRQVTNSPPSSFVGGDIISGQNGPMANVFEQGYENDDDVGLQVESVASWRRNGSGRQRRQHWDPDVLDGSSVRVAGGECVEHSEQSMLTPPRGLIATPRSKKHEQPQKPHWGRVIRLATVDFRSNNLKLAVNEDTAIGGPSISVNESVATTFCGSEVASVMADGVDGKSSDFQCNDSTIINEQSTFLEVPTVSHQDCRRSSVLETFQQLAAGFQGSGRDQRLVKEDFMRCLTAVIGPLQLFTHE